MFPTADQIALAIVTACRLFGDDPFALMRGKSPMRSRLVAYDALLTVFPRVHRAKLGKCLAFGKPRAAQAHVITARKSQWWSEVAVDEVVGALVAHQYGEQAA